MTSSWAQMMAALTVQAPVLLVYLGGIVFSIVFWRRAPKAAMLAMVGSAVLLAAALALPPIQAWILNNRGSAGISSTGQTMAAVGFAFNVLRAVGIGLLIGAVFVGRPREEMLRGFPFASRAGTSSAPSHGLRE